MTILKLVEPKTCERCGKIFEEIPEDHQKIEEGDALDGFYWNCDCRSTLYAPKTKISP